MKLNDKIRLLTTAFTESENYISFSNKIANDSKDSVFIDGLAGSSLSLLIALEAAKTDKNHIVVASGKEEAMSIYDDLEMILDEKNINSSEKSVLFFPVGYSKEYSPTELDAKHLLFRAEVLRAIAQKRNLCVVTWTEALCTMVPNTDFLANNSFTISCNEKIDISFIEEVLVSYGFNQVDFVCEPGEFALRGCICDVYSFSDENPFRIVFSGDMVESIRSFEPATQLTIANMAHIQILPDMSQVDDAENLVSVFDILNKNTCFWINDASANQRFIEETTRLMQGDYVNKILKDYKFSDYIDKFKRVYSFLPNKADNVEKINFYFTPQQSINKKFDWFVEDIFNQISKGWSINILAENDKQIERLYAIFKDIEENKKINITKKINIIKFSLDMGFADNISKTAFYVDHQLFNRYKRSSLYDRFRRPERISINELVNMQPGDYIVHITHGIGRYAGLEKIEINGQTQEAIRLVYKDNNEILVSIHALHRVSKYIGKDGTPPVLDKIGGSSWTTRKNKAKKKVKDIARELVKLYAKRRASKGFAFSPDTYLQHELEASFIYEDTPDQITATESIKNDMEADFPMDRLVCGDVGFGKTELAVRAAFKAVADSKQVAVLVPTTILAFQHYRTFIERLESLPANVEYLNRFRSNSEQKDVLKKVSEGGVDILIGTHRILSKDVEFKNLGLLIIDEEQKFGVAAKEKLRKFCENIDTLTMTATPIPRTLQFSLMGARDMSILRTPPPNRYPVQTEVMTFDPEIIEKAIRYEIDRGGQVYFVHNRIQNIQDVANIVTKLVPNARIAVGHGQMEGNALEKIMLDFISGEIDVFVSTTIVESGLDVPNANTIIINDAQNFGLSDLHQLRGRVGRSNKKAFCYLFTPPEMILSEESRKRLRAISEFSDLGSGFQIAMRDLDIRGAGNLLGAEQSGFISEIGFEMYQKILDEALDELRNDESEYEGVEQQDDADKKYVRDVMIETDSSILIPDNYVPSVSERLLLYKELNEIETEEELEKFKFMLNDRFGNIPAQTLELFDIVRLRWLARQMGIEKLVLKKDLLTLYFIAKKESPFYNSKTFQHVIDYTMKNPRKCILKEQNNRLFMKIDGILSVSDSISLLKSILEAD